MGAFFDLIFLIIFWWWIDKMVKSKTGTGIFERILKPNLYIPNSNPSIPVKNNYQLLFEKFCRVSGKTPLEVFLLARTEIGFGWSDENVEKHLSLYIKSGCTELPNYVESFLDKGKDYIINAEDSTVI